MRRRGLFGWFAGLIAAPAAASGGIGGTGAAEQSARLHDEAALLAISEQSLADLRALRAEVERLRKQTAAIASRRAD